ncbi:MAG: hypothetical protein JW982_00365 [Spirochaetes bacterium]|nr:hypothetical protein [Spirochaetota bacterium]
MNYTVVIADIINSRMILNRKAFQKKLEKDLSAVSEKSGTIISPYTVTLGDEFQAVYTTPENVIKDYFCILMKIFPVKLRCSAGIGKISTEIKTDSSIGMDGPAFYNARKQMEDIKKIDYSIIQINSGDANQLRFINKNLNLMNKIMDRWKYNSLYIFNSLLHGKNFDDIAVDLKISKRGVYKVAETNCIREFAVVFNEIELLISNGDLKK